MTTTLVIAEHDNHAIKAATLSTVTAALQCGSAVHVLVAGHHAGAAAQMAAQISGVSHVWHADAEHLAHGLAEDLAAQVLALSGAYSHLLFAATAAGRSVAPRVAAVLDVAQLSDIVKVVAPDTFDRPIYAGSVIARVQSEDAIKVITVRPTAFAASPASGGNALIEALAAVAPCGLASFVSAQALSSDRPELTSARVVVAGGRALASAENFNALLLPLADKLSAALGASRAAVDAGFAPNDWQVGQTGKIVAPELYIAIGISGAVQHTAGMKDSQVIVAINKDADSPIFGLADYALQADIFSAVPELVAAL